MKDSKAQKGPLNKGQKREFRKRALISNLFSFCEKVIKKPF